MHNSKLLWCLFGSQTLLILFLVFQIKSLNTHVQNLSAKTNASIHNQTSLASDTGIIDHTDIYKANNSPTITEIRAVIAEELQQIKTNTTAQANRTQASSIYTDPQLSQHKIEQMSEDVSDMITALYGQGIVAASDMASIEMAIVELPPAQRRAAFNQLFKAVNNGQITTRF